MGGDNSLEDKKVVKKVIRKPKLKKITKDPKKLKTQEIANTSVKPEDPQNNKDSKDLKDRAKTFVQGTLKKDDPSELPVNQEAPKDPDIKDFKKKSALRRAASFLGRGVVKGVKTVGKNISTTAKDVFNPNSEYRGAGHILQLTGTAGLAKKFINSTGGGHHYSDSDIYSDPDKDRLKRWFEEKWVDIKTGEPCGRKSSKDSSRDYPACRPSVRVNSDTPKTSGELTSDEKTRFKKVKKSSKRIPYIHKKEETGKSGEKNYNKNIPTNMDLYNKVKREADSKFDKPSAYKSGWMVKTYKSRGGEYKSVPSDKDNYSDYSDSDSTYSVKSLKLSSLEKDKLIVEGFLEEVKLIDKVNLGELPKNQEYYKAVNSILAQKQRTKPKNLSNNKKIEREYSTDKNYSTAWSLFNELCENNNK